MTDHNDVNSDENSMDTVFETDMDGNIIGKRYRDFNFGGVSRAIFDRSERGEDFYLEEGLAYQARTDHNGDSLWIWLIQTTTKTMVGSIQRRLSAMKM